MRPITIIPAVLVAAIFSANADDQKKGGYGSEAKLLVRHVVQRSGAEPGAKAPDAVAVLKGEVDKLRSRELLKRVAKAVGPAKILGRADAGDADDAEATSVIQRDLQVRVHEASNLISLRFQHTYPLIAQRVLDQLIKERFEEVLRARRPGSEPPSDAEVVENMHPASLKVIQKPRRIGR